MQQGTSYDTWQCFVNSIPLIVAYGLTSVTVETVSKYDVKWTVISNKILNSKLAFLSFAVGQNTFWWDCIVPLMSVVCEGYLLWCQHPRCLSRISIGKWWKDEPLSVVQSVYLWRPPTKMRCHFCRVTYCDSVRARFNWCARTTFSIMIELIIYIPFYQNTLHLITTFRIFFVSKKG